jgi:hypothetical protein
MNRNELKEHLGGLIDQIVDTNRRLTEDDIIEIQSQFDDIATMVEEFENEDEEETVAENEG